MVMSPLLRKRELELGREGKGREERRDEETPGGGTEPRNLARLINHTINIPVGWHM